jgi:hypothetical protein
MALFINALMCMLSLVDQEPALRDLRTRILRTEELWHALQIVTGMWFKSSACNLIFSWIVLRVPIRNTHSRRPPRPDCGGTADDPKAPYALNSVDITPSDCSSQPKEPDMKRILYACALFSSFIASASAQLSLNPQPALTPLYSSNYAALTDNFYTIKSQDHAAALDIGYADTGILAYMEKSPQPNTKPFKRFYKGAPQYEHFYTANSSEASYVMANGWQYEGVEGHLYTTQVPGSTPMYRLAYFNGSNGDLVHKYTLNYLQVRQLRAQGWSYDGIQGYVYETTNPQVAGGVILGLRCPSSAPAACGGGGLANFRDYYFGSYNVGSTVKTGTTQRMRFNFWSPDFFSDTGHFALLLHGKFSLGSPNPLVVCQNGQINPNCSWHRGLGMAIFGTPGVYGEAFHLFGNVTKLASINNGALSNNQVYSLDLQVNDQGVANYTITHVASNTVMKADSWNAASAYPANSPFPVELTGFAIANATDSQRGDFTLYITNLVVDWLP